MGFKSCLSSIKEGLGVETSKTASKKKELKNIIKLLKKRKEKVGKTSNKKFLKDELDIISLQIKKCEKILLKLEF